MPRRHYELDTKILAVRLMLEGKTTQQIRRSLRSPVSTRTLECWMSLYKRTSLVIRNADQWEHPSRSLIFTDEDRAFMLGLVEANPTLYLDETQIATYQNTGQGSTDLKSRLLLDLKKAKTVHPNRNENQRTQFLYTMGGLQPDQMVFLDESAVAEGDLYHPYTRARKGGQTMRLVRSCGGKRYSLLPAVCNGGVLAIDCKKGSYHQKEFEFFLKHHLLPVMRPFPQPRSVLIMDNAAIHHGGRIAELCEARGVRLIYTPPYSPDLNPLDRGFGVLKAHFQQMSFVPNAPVKDRIQTIIMKTSEVLSEALMRELYVRCWYWI